jgi:phosphoribosyl 1,2-cyclic phosphate phosphodiesterase
MLKITVLGCGASLGTPIIGCKCSVCISGSQYNKRSRSSILINNNDTTVLVDFGFDIRSQLLSQKVSHIDGAILTHDHADHVGGIDDLRVFPYLCQAPLDIYTREDIVNKVSRRYEYLFGDNKLALKSANVHDNLNIKNMELRLFNQHHGSIDSFGIRVGDFVFSCDVSDFPEESESYLYGIDTWLLDCVDYNSNYSHAGLDKIFLWDKKFNPKKIYLTNMGHGIDYHKIINELPPHIRPAYDGLNLEC